ncbi:LysM peptidoglycan-binding domain-containing protein [Flavobacterium sp. NKUCC04_CG]|uniref:LysM peptidoglycan-binding domain-containing protein n=1 Tax=Flavobacterium sp. NKUCC04_CG TaxID=2842121 RepID=UPI001C5B5137|nr:LysM peptidoglycan-binding domain-containing protein [Flavobacterium sp. NKUCC04_CG]MBW3519852.1 hypothetical protein [Flavobacterium sp. NKUCC04_CG]
MTTSYQKSYGIAAYLKFVGKPLVMTAVVNEEEQIFIVELKDFTLKDLITGIVQIVKPGFELQIPTPWNYILEFNIPEFKLMLKAPNAPNSKIEFGIAFDPGFNDFGLKISHIEVFARSIREVNINMEGSLDIFGLQFDLANLFGSDGVNLLGAEGLPQPKPNGSLFDLKFIGIGQHIQLQKAASYSRVKEVINDMLELFDPPAPGTVVPDFTKMLRFSNESDWLFGLDVEIMKTVALQVVFNDPVLYGIYIKLSGDKAKVLDGLEFEILYKKITDDIGVYQIELKLPDAIRNLEFGAVSVTLPVIAIWIYTNGNFKVDFGFPYNNDFSRSFGVQCFPFVGQGGFYFAYLNGATSVTVPQTNLGTFDPVLEFGLGLNIGLGKTLNKGILSAGLTITFYGVLEGTLAWFKPYKTTAVLANNATDLYYRVKGTFALVGHIYGSVNFAIISATLDILVYAMISVEVEAGAPIYLSFEAGVSLRLTVKINLGIFKIKIHLSFAVTIRESFTIGQASPTQWNTVSQLKSAANSIAFAAQKRGNPAQQPIVLNWNQVFNQDNVERLTVNLIPLFSAAKVETTQSAIGIASLFLENNRALGDAVLRERIIDANALKSNSPFQAFDKLCIAVLSWILNAANSPTEAAGTFEKLLIQKIDKETLTKILEALNEDNDSDNVPFTYEQIVSFISSLFVLNIIDPNTDHKKALLKNTLTAEKTEIEDLFLTIFPMIPQLFMSNSYNDTVVDFSTCNAVNKDYLRELKEQVKQFSPESAVENKYTADLLELESIATYIFRDYFLLIGKSLLQTACDVMEVYDYRITKAGTSLAAVATQFSTTATALVNSNKTVEGLLLKDQPIAISGTTYSIEADDTFDKINALHPYSKQDDAWSQEWVSLNSKVQLFIPMSQIKLPGSQIPYRVLAEDTLESIAEKNNLTKQQLAAVISLNAHIPILAAFTAVKLPAFMATVPEQATFLSIATDFNIPLEELAKANERNTKWLALNTLICIENVTALTSVDLLNAVYQKDFFIGAGGNASRFSLHGLRLPMVTAVGDAAKETQGLYALSGQQFTLPHIDNIDSFEYTFTLSKTQTASPNDTLPWVIFNGEAFAATLEETVSLSYKLLDVEKQRVQNFQQITIKPLITEGPKALKLYQDQEKTFAFANPILWEKEGGISATAIWNFSKSLNTVLHQTPEIDIKVAVQDRPGAKRSIKDLEKDSYSFSTFIPLTVKRASSKNGSKINKCTFEVFGTDATGIDLLTALLEDDQKEFRPKELTILFSSDATQDKVKALHSYSSEDLLLLLINTNLSTETNPKFSSLALTEQKISNTPIATCIERIWKSSLVRTGGYYLYLETSDGGTLPDSVFSANGEAELYVMITYEGVVNEVSHKLKPFMNALVTTKAINASQELLFGSWKVDLENNHNNVLVQEGKLERNAILKPGNIGFELTRINPTAPTEELMAELSPDYQYELEQQYNLINFKTVGSGDFKAITSLLPLSPQDVENQDNANDIDQDLWRYAKALPVARIYQTAQTNSKPLWFSAQSSPYLGLSKTLELDFNWQDNYGNVLDTAIPSLATKIGYFDQLIPLSAWPVLTVDFAFEKQPQSQDNFSLNLDFYPADNYSWNPGSQDAANDKILVLQRAVADLEQYISIYYQVVELDFNVSFQVTLDPTHTYPKTETKQTELKKGLLVYLETVIEWINNFIENPDSNNQFEGVAVAHQRYRYHYNYRDCIADSQPNDIFALAVTVGFSRSEDLIDSQFVLSASPKVFVPGVQSVSCSIKPKLKGFESDSEQQLQKSADTLMLTAFAKQFESTFKEERLKMAATYVSETASSITGAKEEALWVIRFKDINSKKAGIGFDIKFEEVVCFAPQPLVNFLANLTNIPIYPFSHYLTTEVEAPVVMSFNNVDTELWATRLLSGLEEVLAPDLSLPITMIDHLNGSKESAGILANLLEAKEILAQAIALQTIPILEYDTKLLGGQELAREKIKQQLLINLADGYALNAVVQYQTAVDSPYPDSDQIVAPNLYGKPFAAVSSDAETNENYVFSTAKIPLRNFNTDLSKKSNSYLTYTFSTQKAKLDSNLSLAIDYQISHLEFDITKLKVAAISEYSSDLSDYELSKWLTFIVPLKAQNQTDKIGTQIPIPIRQYPNLPAFGSQIFVAPIPDKRISINKVKYSDFLFDYTIQEYTAQDTYHFEVYFNAKQSDWKVLEEEKDLSIKQKELFVELAQFESVRENFNGFFKDELPKVNAAISEAELKRLSNALNSYRDLVGKVADKWLKLYSPDPSLLMDIPPLDVVKVSFDITERDSDSSTESGLFEIIVSNWSATAKDKAVDYVNYPIVQINGYIAEVFVTKQSNASRKIRLPRQSFPQDYVEVSYRYYQIIAGKKQYLSFTDGIAIRERSICFVNLSVLQIQNGWAGLYIQRNANLSGRENGLNTSPEFVYATPVKRFSNPITPSQKITQEIPLLPLLPVSNSLMDYLKGLLTELLASSTGPVNPVRLKIWVNYTYCLHEIPIQLPVVLMPPTVFDQTDAAGTGIAITALNKAILDWFHNKKPAQQKGILSFAVTFYSSIDEDNILPLLSLEKITLKIAAVADITNQDLE